jgi:putative thioredoxin
MLASTDAPGAAQLVKDTTTKDFVVDVIEESKKQPVLVDFWAPWCGPCKQLTPVLEKVVREAKGKVKLVKMNIDDHPAIPGQMGIQSIPAVIAFKSGRPLDGFMGALPESQIKQFLAGILGGEIGPSDVEQVLEAAEALLAEGDAAQALEAFAAALELDKDDVRALAGMAQANLKAGSLDQAKAALAMVPAAKEAEPAVAAARAAIELAEKSAALGDLAPLTAAVEADPKNHRARFDLAVGLAAAGRREEAVDHLVEIVRKDRAWDDDGARRQLVQFFEAWGPTDDMTIQGRRRLSSVLFS